MAGGQHSGGGGHGSKAVLAALAANVGIAVAKFVGFAVTGAASMLAEAVHSVADAGNQALLLLGGRRARRQADELHPFGYGRERYFWSFLVAMVLFSLGGAFAIAEGVSKIRDPHELESAPVAMAILGVAMVLEATSLRTARNESRPLRGDAGWWAFVRRSRTPELPVVLLEDLGALVGLILALGTLVVAEVTGEPLWDGIGTLSIGILLTVIATVLAVEMKSLLIGESAEPRAIEAIRAAVTIEPAAVRLIHMRTQHVGPEELLVAMKVQFADGLEVHEIAETVDRIESNVRRGVPSARMIYIEPDILRTARARGPGPGADVPPPGKEAG